MRSFPMFMAQDVTRRTSSSWREKGRYVNFVPRSFKVEFEAIVRNLHLLKPLGWWRNEPPVNPGSVFGRKWRQNTWSAEQLVLPQDPDYAEMKASTDFAVQRLEPAPGATFQLWNGFNHDFPANPTFFSHWLPPVHFYIFILGSQVSTDVLNRNICESDLCRLLSGRQNPSLTLQMWSLMQKCLWRWASLSLLL